MTAVVVLGQVLSLGGQPATISRDERAIYPPARQATTADRSPAKLPSPDAWIPVNRQKH